jgi:glutathione S-transferase
VWGERTDVEILNRTLREEIPAVLDYLETELPAAGFLFDTLSIADVSVATFFRNAAFARFAVDGARWPITAGFVERTFRHESFARLRPFEDRLMRTPIAEHRTVLAEMGAPLTAETYGTAVPRRGVMRI